MLAASIPVADSPSCADPLLADWYDDGVVQGTYDPQCYQDALDALPEDVRIYTTAFEDLSRALRERVGETGQSDRRLSGVGRPEREAAPPVAVETTPARRPPLPVVLVVALVAILAGGALAGPAARRARRR